MTLKERAGFYNVVIKLLSDSTLTDRISTKDVKEIRSSLVSAVKKDFEKIEVCRLQK